MKLTVTLIGVLTLFSLNSLAEEYTRWHLPDNAKVRLGKGAIHEVEYSPEGTRLAVASSLGIWLYDTETLEEVTLITDKPRWLGSMAFNTTGERLVSGGGAVRLWNAENGRACADVHRKYV